MVIKFEFGKCSKLTFGKHEVALNFISVFLLCNLFATITWMVNGEAKKEWLEMLQKIQDDNEYLEKQKDDE